MRILVVGAGAIGGYFGGRLLAAGRDVTFLVRPARAQKLAAGLFIRSRFGDASLPAPPTVTAESLNAHFDLVLLGCKAYDLAGAIKSFAAAVGPDTAVLPLLNGMKHLDVLAERFGGERVLGGLAIISTTLDGEGRILHLNDLHLLAFGERDNSPSPRIKAIAAELSDARFDARLSDNIMQEMWEKWAFIASSAGINCLMRATVGDVVAAGGADLAAALMDECCAIATAQGFPPRAAAVERMRAILTAPGSTFAASMLRDIERGAPIEAGHIVGDLLARGTAQGGRHPLLRIADAHLKAYEARRSRERASGNAA